MKAELDENTLNYKLSSGTQGKLLMMIVIGIICAALSFFIMHDPARSSHMHHTAGWSTLLIGVFLTFSIAITGLFFTAISHITGSKWSITVRRIAESYSKYLWVGLVLLAPIIIWGVHDLYEWSHTDVVATDKLLKHKSGWLNMPFFPIRLIIIGLVWIFFGHLFYKNSVAQDSDKDVSHTKKNNKLAAIFLLIFAITFSVVAYDLLMSLTPHWFSTMWAVYIFAGAYQAGLSSFVVFIYHLKKNGYLGDAVNENHYHDIAKFMMSFCVFWAYVGFSQFMLIWYANLPEETFWFEMRLQGGWTWLTLAMPFIKFVLPFLLLINRPNKRNLDFLNKVAIWIIFVQFLELYWIVFPSNFEEFNVMGLILSFGVSIGMLGIFGFSILKGMEKAKLVPVGDPRLDECLHHHQ
ncbi:MAG: hypothetical protein KDK36_05875 [Leptospiraceae bacterium]|nr:hypothetical protein [Leptospiraceae bacterium]